MLPLSIIYACFNASCLEFSFYPLSLFHPKSTLALALRVRDDTGPSSARAGGTGEASGGASLAGRARCNPNPNPNRAISPELYPFIYCLTILGVFYAATVGFYRCTYFRILFCTFYSRFTLLQYTYARRVIVPDNKSPVEKYCSVLVVAFGGQAGLPLVMSVPGRRTKKATSLRRPTAW